MSTHVLTHNCHRFEIVWVPHRTPSLLSSRILWLTSLFRVLCGVNGCFLVVPSVLEISQNQGNLNLANMVGVKRVPIHISPKEWQLVLRYAATHYRAIWTYCVTTFLVAIFLQSRTFLLYFRNEREEFMIDVFARSLLLWWYFYWYFYGCHKIADAIFASYYD